MNSKKVNWMFLSTILVEFAVVFLLSVNYQRFQIDVVSNLVISELILVLPAFLFLVASRTKFSEIFPFRRIKTGSVFMIILFTYLSLPLVTTINAISMLFTDNVVEEMSADILQMPFLLMLFLMGIMGPVCEELVFRGIVYGGYRRSGNVFRAMIFSALLFGIMHMNFNQMLYAAVIGFILVLLREATGSLWGPVIYHVVFNSNTVIMLYASSKMPMEISENQVQYGTEAIIRSISVSMAVAAVCMAIAWCVLVWVGNHENREGFMLKIWKERKNNRGKIVTIPLLISLVLCFFFMILQLFL